MSLFREIIVDNFAGGGGASTGIELATGRSVDIAINHDPDAIAMHKMNHPDTEHYCESVWEVNPREAVAGRPVALCWLSPDCKHFSKAKGATPVNKNIRGLAWVAVRWAATVKPRVIMLENVEEFKTWGPIVDGKPCPENKGKTFKSFVRALERQGYQVEFKSLIAADYGAPTIRKRLFMIARRDGQKIVWPKATHAKQPTNKNIKPWRTAAEIIDWSLPCPSIFERKRPLAENTMRRIAKGIQKFVVEAQEPFIVTCNHSGKYFRGQGLNEPFKTIAAAHDAHGLVQPVLAPFITEHANASNQRNMAANEPLRTICAQVKGGHFALVSAFLAKHYTGVTGSKLQEPVHTVTSVDHNALVTSHLIKMRGNNTGHATSEPLHTITSGGNHLGEVRSFLVEYYGNGGALPLDKPLHTVTCKEKFGLVTIKGVDYQIVDIGMRMLEPHELFAAQGFPSDYIISVDPEGKKVSKKNQVARCGNSVCPPISQALVEANLPELCRQEVAA